MPPCLISNSVLGFTAAAEKKKEYYCVCAWPGLRPDVVLHRYSVCASLVLELVKRCRLQVAMDDIDQLFCCTVSAYRSASSVLTVLAASMHAATLCACAADARLLIRSSD